MSSVLNRASRNFLWRHPWQLALALVGIALGVAVVVAIELAMESALSAFDQTRKAFSGTATHRIVAGDGGLDEKLYTRLRVEQGIQQLSPIVSGHVRLPNDSFKLIGIDPFVEKSFQSAWQQQYSDVGFLARLITEPGTALISEQTAARLHLRVDDEITVKAGNGEHRLKIIALLSPSQAISEQALSGLIITDIATAQEVLGLFGRLSSIDALIDDDASETLARICQVLPANVLLLSADSQSQAMREMTRAFSINLKALGLLSLLVGLFLIYNTMTFLVVQRRRLIGSLRAMGVTRRQIFNLIINEAFWLAIAGTAIGIALGIMLAQGLLHLISGTLNAVYFRIDAASLMITPAQLGKGILLGIGATLLAVLPPALEATRLPPTTVLIRSQLESGVRRLIKVTGLAGGLFILAGLVLALWSGKSIALGLVGIFLLLFGFALLTPVFTLMVMKLAERVFGRISGILGRLPARMVSAEISRTGIAIAALMMAVAATIGMDLMIGSFRQTVQEWLQSALRADLYVSLPGEKTPAAASGDHGLKARLAAHGDVQMLSTLLATNLIANDELTKVSVYELNPQARRGFTFKQAAAGTVWNRFEREQTIIVTEPYAYHHDVKVGQTIMLRTEEDVQPFEAIAIEADYSDQGHLVMSRRNYERYWPDLGYSGIGVYAKPGIDLKRLEDQLGQRLKAPQSIQSNRAIYEASMDLFEQTFTITETLRWLSAIIAFVGVFSALMALQFERTRQLGVLRAIGVTPAQLTVLIIGETGLMGLAAGLFAVPVGYIVAYVLIFVIYLRSFGWTMAFHMNAAVVYQGLALAFGAALLAGVLPALKMLRTRPAEALRNE
ncbi:FtsX-like permease family protein [Methylobacter luteus]|uniref:FtsX-like permease family protein n=1 Tax=Methylobacter luteus TaxID=415 RepID=UPI000429C5D6|nr:FtsX-like permease family protein [Methylobacter luteus]